ncbi:MAG TPA: group I intron-associated PD-(D/E)XK endonuclease [Methylomirabilota bacterium]|nr:group I intron-associated PD-(D/E)XK endonuclease [Methylomirabilota bacterium]
MILSGKSKRDTNTIGEISESAIITRFLQLGYKVFIPYGGKQRYDLVIEDEDGQCWRVQCKTGRIQDNGTVVAFDTANHNVALKNSQWRPYRGQCNYFAVYCEELNKVYLILVDEVGNSRANLRLVPAKNNQEKNVRWAKDYEL